MAGSYKDLRVWQEAMQLVIAVYRITRTFPKDELYGLTTQLRRAAVSIPSNIAEGKGHWTDREFCQFLFHARGSLLEVQTQVMIAQELQYCSDGDAEALLRQAAGVGGALNGLIKSLQRGKAAGAGS